MNKSEEIESLKRKLLLPSLPESAKERLRAKLAELESSDGGNEEGDVLVEIEAIKKKIALPSLPESAKERLRAKLAELEKSVSKKETQKEEKPAPKKRGRKPMVKKEPKAKFVKKQEEVSTEEKPAPKKRGRKPSATKKEEVSKEPKVIKKRGRKPKKKETPTIKTRVKKVYKPTLSPNEGEPDCDTLLKKFRERRAKAKASQKKRKTTPVFRKIASDVVDAVEKAIKNVPSKQIKESPKVTIRKFGNLQKAADSFLKAFREVLGSDYQKSQADIEINELKKLIEGIIKKYSIK